MDKLSTLKKQWNSQKFEQPLSKEELYKLTQKKSISSIKWIFIFSCFEFFAYLLLPLIIPDYFDSFEYYKSIHLFWLSILVSCLGYFILLYFMIKFYKNYKNIKTSDSISSLINTIISARKSVNKYVIYNLGIFAIFFIIVLINAFQYDENFINILKQRNVEHYSVLKMVIVISGVTILVFTILIGFYYLIYGRYFFRLKNNIKELQKIDD